jgi:hypothetical protein
MQSVVIRMRPSRLVWALAKNPFAIVFGRDMTSFDAIKFSALSGKTKLSQAVALLCCESGIALSRFCAGI